MKPPTFHLERPLWQRGVRVAGVDEVGCGCLAGPVVAAAVCLSEKIRIRAIHDSKLLTPNMRLEIFRELFLRGAVAGIGIATVAEIDELNIRRASIEAMRRAVHALPEVSHVLVDAWHIPMLGIPQTAIIHGDRLVKSIAAASIVAKVARDRLMENYGRDFPAYGFAIHKGYATRLHRRAIAKYGRSELHRKSFTCKVLTES